MDRFHFWSCITLGTLALMGMFGVFVMHLINFLRIDLVTGLIMAVPILFMMQYMVKLIWIYSKGIIKRDSSEFPKISLRL